MAVAWPSSVPECFEKNSYNYRPQNALIRTDMDTGPPKVRRRFTAITKDHSGTIIMDTTEKESFETWFYTTAGFGSEEFTITNPQDDADTITCRFKSGNGEPLYNIKQNGGTLDWEIQFTMEELP